MKNTYKQTNSLGKKITSIVTALVLLASSGTTIGVVRNRKNKNNTDNVSNTTSVSVSTNQNSNLNLSDDFDINDKSEVIKRAKEIYELSNKDLSVDEIVNLIYLINGKYANLDLSGEKTEFKKLQTIFISLTDILNDYVVNWVNKKDSKKLIHAYMFMSDIDKKSVITKEDAFELSNIVNNYLKALKKNNEENREKYAEKYYKFVVKIQNKINESKKVCDGYEWAVLTQIMVNNPLFSNDLSKDELNDLDKISKLAGTRGTAFSEEVVAKNGIDKTKDLEEAQKDGNYGYKTPYTSGYNKEDAKKAEKIESTTEKKKVVVDKGGKEIKTEQEQINTPTTSVSKETYVATTEGKKNTKETSTSSNETSNTTKETSNKNNSDTTKSTKETNNSETTKSTKETTEVITEIIVADVITGTYEEVIEEGGKIVSEYYVDADQTKENVKTKIK